MNKLDLVKEIALGADISLEKSELVLNVILSRIQTTLVNHESIQIASFGSFTIKSRSPRKGRNPKTGETIDIGASSSIKFTAGKGFKDYLNNNDQ